MYTSSPSERSKFTGFENRSKHKRLEKVTDDNYRLNEQEFHGWLDNPHALYIFDHSGLEMDAMLLTRSFSDEIFEFIDRETVERTNDEN